MLQRLMRRPLALYVALLFCYVTVVVGGCLIYTYVYRLKSAITTTTADLAHYSHMKRVCSARRDDTECSSTCMITRRNIQALKTLIPDTYSHKHRNPCWYSSLSIPLSLSSRFTNTMVVRGPLFENVSRAEQIVKRTLSTMDSRWHERNLFCLPAVYIAAFPKCGTTTLYELLISHPLVAQPLSKEGHFWSTFSGNGTFLNKQLHILWYLHRFIGAANEISKSPQSLTIDASPSMLWKRPQSFEYDTDFCEMPHMVASLTPAAKFIVIMRNPVKRLFSEYWFFCSNQNWVRSGRVVVPPYYTEKGKHIFHNLTIAAIKQFRSCVASGVPAFKCVYRATAKKTDCFHVRLGVGMYYFHIVRWLATVSLERFLFLKTEELAVDPYSTLQRVWSFLNLTAQTREAVNSLGKMWNSNDWIRSEQYRDKFEILPETAKILHDFYRPYNKLLAELLSDYSFLWKKF